MISLILIKNSTLIRQLIILKDRENIKNVLEIGLGTNDSKFMSSMGDDGKPGSSIRAFRDYLPNAQIYGADVDRKILFEEELVEMLYTEIKNNIDIDDAGF